MVLLGLCKFIWCVKTIYSVILTTCCAYRRQIFCSLKMHDESTKRDKVEEVQEGALPPYLLDRDQTQRAKVIASSLYSSYIHF